MPALLAFSIYVNQRAIFIVQAASIKIAQLKKPANTDYINLRIL
jgi:hypothetical protein